MINLRIADKDEQISVSLRYPDKGLLHEDFYNFVRAEGLDSESVKNTLKVILNVMEVDSMSHLVAQCYDGAAVMSGKERTPVPHACRSVPQGNMCTVTLIDLT